MKNLIFTLIMSIYNVIAFSQSIHYDNLSRIDSITMPDSSYILYKYDHTGNILSRKEISVCDRYALPAISGLHTICRGDSTQLVSSLATKFLWSTGDTTRSIWVKDTGKYSVKIIYANECEKQSLPFAVQYYSPTIDTIVSTKPKLCNGADTINLSANGSNQYLWSNGDTFSQIKIVDTGKYIVQVTDANGCKSKDTVHIGRFNIVPLTVQCSDSMLCPSETTSLIVNSNFTNFLWNTGATTQTLSVSQAGSFFVTGIDTNGCKAQSRSVAIQSVPAPLAPRVTQSGMNLCIPPNYSTYMWSTGTTTNCTTIPSLGSYAVTVSDSNACTVSNSVTVKNSNCFPLAGSYTIGTNGDFTTIPLAISRLYSCGVSGSVVLKIKSGNYFQSMSFTDTIAGSSATNTITITSEKNHSDSVKIYSDTSLNYHLSVNRAKFLRFENLRFNAIKEINSTQQISLTNTENITFLNCEYSVTSSKLTSMHYINIKKSNNVSFDSFRVLPTLPHIALLIDSSSKIIVKNSYFNLLNTYSKAKNIDIQKSNILNLNLSSSDSIYLFGNYIKQYAFSSNNVIADSNFFDNSSSIGGKYYRISRNVFNNGLGNLYGDSSSFFNNIIIGRSSFGINATATRTKIYNNTIVYPSNTINLPVIVAKITGNQTEFINNIVWSNIVYPANGSNWYLTNLELGTGVISNYNLIYNSKKSVAVKHNSILYPTLHIWQNYSGNDLQSISDSIAFVGVNNYRIGSSSIIDNAGMKNLLVTVDFDRIPRSSIRPDLGAFEYGSVPSCLDFASISASKDTICRKSSMELIANNADSTFWLPTTNFSGSTSKNILINPATTTTYTLISKIGTCIDTLQKTIYVDTTKSNPYADSITISQSGQNLCVLPSNHSYIWKCQNSSIQGSTNCIQAVGLGSYSVELIDNFGCKYSRSINVPSYSCSPLSGTYKLGGSNSHFTTIESAISALYQCGISSSVVFEMRNGTYQSSFLFTDSILGASISKTITFKSESSNTDSVKILGDNLSNELFKLISAKFLSFENLSFNLGRHTLSNNQIYTNGASYLKYLNCKFTLPQNNITNYYGVRFQKTNYITFDNTRQMTGTQNCQFTFDTTNNIVIKNSVFNNLIFYGNSKDITISNNNISAVATYTNTFEKFKIFGNNIGNVSFSNLKYSQIDSNLISGYLWCSNCIKDTINKNQLLSSINLNGDTLQIANNFVFGHLVSGANRTNIFHNSLYRTTYNSSSGPIGTFSGTGVNVKNNIFKSSKMDQLCASFTSSVVSDYNIYAKPLGGVILSRNGVNYSSLSAYKVTTTMDSNSIADTVKFVSATNLHLQSSQNISFNGMALGFARDIDGHIRSSTTPTIGADELGSTLKMTQAINSQKPKADSISAIQLVLKPNPTSGILYVKLESSYEINEAAYIMDMNGRILIDAIRIENSKFNSVDVSNLSTGVYYIRTVGTGLSGKFMKE